MWGARFLRVNSKSICYVMLLFLLNMKKFLITPPIKTMIKIINKDPISAKIGHHALSTDCPVVL